jgi:hypothetical protein
MVQTTWIYRAARGAYSVTVCTAIWACAGMAMAQGTAAASAGEQCILAGRLDGNQRWAPQARGIELMDAAGKRVASSDKAALASVKQVRVSSPALLSGCNGNQALARGDDQPGGKKASSPAVSAAATPLNVEAVNFPPLKVGGELVELRLGLVPERVISLTR